jgi:myo-inositol-1(or 4)-monophosphatase
MATPGEKDATAGADPIERTEMIHRFHAAMAIAREAGMMARAAFHNRPAFSADNFKGPQDYLTETDGAVEAFIRRRFAEAFPQDSFFGEEAGGQTRGNAWLVDPIDGTANFARGIPVFCVSIAFVHARRTEIGVIFDPLQQELFAARRGAGATLNGRAITVSPIADMRHATLEIGWSTRLPHEVYIAAVRRAKEAGANVRRSGSGALGLAYVAAGRMEGYAELHMNPWDALAGQLLVREAGGTTNDFLAGDGLRKGNAVIAACSDLYEKLNQIMKPAG